MKAYHTIFLKIFFLFGIIFLLSCKKEEVEPLHPIENDEVDLPVLYLEKGSDILIEQDLYLDSVILFIDEGVNIRFKNGAGIIVGDHWPAVIQALGKEENPINFIPYSDSSNPDEYWGGIQIHGSSKYINTFEHCNFIKGCGDESDAVLYQEYGHISIKNCLFNFSKKYGVHLYSYTDLEAFENNIIKHTFDHPLVMGADNVHIIGENNIFISDSQNKGIYLSPGSAKSLEVVSTLSDDDTIVWKAQMVPYIIKNALSFGEGNFKICEGTIIAMENPYGYSNCYIYIGSNYFEAAGTADNPVIFTSNELDKQPGDWDFISIGTDAKFNNCIFEYGGGQYVPNFLNQSMIIVSKNSYASFDSCIFRFSETDAVGVYGEFENFALFQNFSNNTFSDLKRYAISMYPESIHSLGENNNFNNYLIHLRSLTITRQYTYWKNPGGAFYIDDYIKLNNDYATLEFGPGVVLKFDNGGIKIGDSKTGTLICKGTKDEPVIFTSAKSNPDRGDWSGIYFGNKSTVDCILEHCQVLYAGNNGSTYPASIRINSQMTVKNCTIAHSRHWGISYSESYNPVIENNTFLDNLDGDIIGY